MPNYFKNNRHSNNPPFHFSDPQLVPRVRQYIDENRNRQYVDITMMADSLQQRYPRDYSRRKRIAFRGMVSRAYQYLLQQNDSSGRDNSYPSHNNSNINSSFSNDPNNGPRLGNEDDIQDDDVIVDGPDKDPNLVNKQLANLYSSSPMLKKNNHDISKPEENDQELINLSSDDETNTEHTNSKKRTKIDTLLKETETNVASPAPDEPALASSEVPPVKGVKRKAGESLLPSLSVLRRKKREIPLTKSTVTLKDVGGNRKTIEEVIKLLIHLKHPEVYKTIGVTLPRGFLLHGPPGCGKTLLAHAIAGELDLPLLKVAGPELVAGVSGESEERIRDLFEQAVSLAPCILFMDEVDVISSRRESAHRNMEQRIVAQLLCSLDNLDNVEKGNQVLVIGATNRHDSMDPALRRAGRFDREICLGIPDKKSRLQILQILVANMKLSKNVSLEQLAALTPGYVGADLKSLTREAAIAAVSRICEDVQNKRMKAIESSEENETKNSKAKNEDITIDENSEDITILQEPTKTNEVSDKNSDCDIVEVDEDNSEAETSKVEEKGKKDSEDVIVEKSFVVTEDRLKESISNYYSDSNDQADSTEERDPKNEGQPMEVEETSEVNKEEEKEESEEVPKESDKSKFYCSFGLNSKESIDESIESLLVWLRDKTPLSEAELSELFVEFADFEKALKTVQPSSKREGFATVPDVTWDDVGSLSDIRQELQMAILAPVQHSELFSRLGLTAPTGVLLCGPPGCGKTLLAKAVANEAGINFISVKGPELLNMYLGESERAVRQCFERARNSQPCVIFFDELDALCPKRSESRDSGGGMRVVNQLLTEMDGVEGRQSVFLMAATNRPDMIDPAVLRPGRLDKILYVGLPKPDGRVDILKALTKNGTCPAMGPDVDLNEVGSSEQCEGFSGADLAALIREAGVQALREYLEQPSSVLGGLEFISLRHFEAAFKKIRKSVSDKDQIYYERLRLLYSPSSTTSRRKATENESPTTPKR